MIAFMLDTPASIQQAQHNITDINSQYIEFKEKLRIAQRNI
jgi:hypothetical protein